jgi:alcohol dehydrogenase
MSELLNQLDRTYVFHVPTQMNYGAGVAGKVGEVTREMGGRKALLVTDQGIAKAGLADKITASLESEGVKVEVFEKAAAEPTDVQVQQGVDRYKEVEADSIVALGGGAVMDAAKGMKVMATHEGSIVDYSMDYGGADNIKPNSIPLIVLPTTSGTGSEAGGGAVIIDSKRSMKVCAYSEHIAPTVALVDPLLTVKVPPKLTAYTGLDALAQAIGAYVINISQPAADALALHAVELIYSNLGRAVAKGDDLEARANMAYGSMISGIAMYNTDCSGEHALGETIGPHYGLPHGLTVAIFLPYVMDMNRLAVPERFVRLARAMGRRTEGLTSRDASREAVRAVVDLLRDLEIPSLKEAGVREKDFEELTAKTMGHYCVQQKLNVCEMTEDTVMGLYRKAYRNQLFDVK